MSLILQAIFRGEEPLSVPLLGRFDERGGDIGRSDSVTFTLPDAERLISRQQARISSHDGLYWIENIGAAAILHNGRPLSTGMRVALGEGDDLRIGDYRLTAAFESDETSATMLRGRTFVRAEPHAAPADLSESATAQARRAAEDEQDGAPPMPAVDAPGLPPPSAPTEPAGREGAAARSEAQGRASKAGRGRLAAGAAASVEDCARALQAGLALETPLAPDALPEMLSAIGAMLRVSIGGLHAMLAMRSADKNEMHADATLIEKRGNNPLKFVADPAVALQMLLQPPLQGFLAGSAALQDAVDDLRAHHLALVAGMQAALSAMLDPLDPEQLEKELAARTAFDTLLPWRRRARLWDLYVERNRRLRAQVKGDHALRFGAALRDAYQQQMHRLEDETKSQDRLARAPSGKRGDR